MVDRGSSLDDHYRCVGEQFLVIQCAEGVDYRAWEVQVRHC